MKCVYINASSALNTEAEGGVHSIYHQSEELHSCAAVVYHKASVSPPLSIVLTNQETRTEHSTGHWNTYKRNTNLEL